MSMTNRERVTAMDLFKHALVPFLKHRAGVRKCHPRQLSIP
jgi:hypothetical protein